MKFEGLSINKVDATYKTHGWRFNHLLDSKYLSSNRVYSNTLKKKKNGYKTHHFGYNL